MGNQSDAADQISEIAVDTPPQSNVSEPVNTPIPSQPSLSVTDSTGNVIQLNEGDIHTGTPLIKGDERF